MILYFENDNGERREIGRPISEIERNLMIYKFLKDHDYQSYYMRTWQEGDETWIDVGSHSEFFISVEKK